MALRPSYRNLQLDPDDRFQMLAFSAFSWQHILENVSRRWISEVRNGTIRMHYRTMTTPSGQSCSVFNKQLNETVSAFVEKYATIIWPAEGEGRAHLANARHTQDMRDIYATTANMVINHRKEALMRECNVALSGGDPVAESLIGHRVRLYLMQLLISDEPVPARQLSAMALLRQFLMTTYSPNRSNSKRSHASTRTDRFDSRRASEDQRSVSPRARKRRRVSDTATPPTHSPYEHSAGHVRLQFTYSGFQRLQRILFCPSRPPAIIQKRTRRLEEPTHPQSTHTGNENSRPQEASFPTEGYQCWLRSCGEVFQAVGDVVDHVQREHAAMARALAGLFSSI